MIQNKKTTTKTPEPRASASHGWRLQTGSDIHVQKSLTIGLTNLGASNYPSTHRHVGSRFFMVERSLLVGWFFWKSMVKFLFGVKSLIDIVIVNHHNWSILCLNMSKHDIHCPIHLAAVGTFYGFIRHVLIRSESELFSPSPEPICLSSEGLPHGTAETLRWSGTAERDKAIHLTWKKTGGKLQRFENKGWKNFLF